MCSKNRFSICIAGAQAQPRCRCPRVLFCLVLRRSPHPACPQRLCSTRRLHPRVQAQLSWSMAAELCPSCEEIPGADTPWAVGSLTPSPRHLSRGFWRGWFQHRHLHHLCWSVGTVAPQHAHQICVDSCGVCDCASAGLVWSAPRVPAAAAAPGRAQRGAGRRCPPWTGASSPWGGAKLL